MDDTRDLLERIVEQNDALLEQGRTSISALQDVVDKLGEIHTQLLLNDVSSEVGTIIEAIDAVAEKLG